MIKLIIAILALGLGYGAYHEVVTIKSKKEATLQDERTNLQEASIKEKAKQQNTHEKIVEYLHSGQVSVAQLKVDLTHNLSDNELRKGLQGDVFDETMLNLFISRYIGNALFAFFSLPIFI